MKSLRLSGMVRESIVDGPGIRLVVFTQGCPHHCVACHNPQTHPFEDGYDYPIEQILTELDKNSLLSGVTFSGGEPFCQSEALAELAHEIKLRKLNLITYSGYTYEQLQQQATTTPSVAALLDLADYLIDGPFVLAQRDLTLSFRGSSNQRIIDLSRSRATGTVVLADFS